MKAVTVEKERFALRPQHKFGKYNAPYQVFDSKEEANDNIEKHPLFRFEENWNFQVYPVKVKVKLKANAKLITNN